MAQIPIVIEKPLTAYIQELSECLQLNKVVLFGSMAQDTFDGDSDIDLAIFSADATDKNRLDLMTDALIKAMPYKLDIQPLVFPLADYHSDNDFIQKEIIERGVEIYPAT